MHLSQFYLWKFCMVHMQHIAYCIICVCVCVCVCACVWVCRNCALPGHTTYTVCTVYRLRPHCTVHSAHLPCLLLKRNSFVCLLSPIPFNCCQIYQSVTKADVDLNKYITKLRVKKSSITSWLELLEYDGRRKHRAIVY